MPTMTMPARRAAVLLRAAANLDGTAARVATSRCVALANGGGPRTAGLAKSVVTPGCAAAHFALASSFTWAGWP